MTSIHRTGLADLFAERPNVRTAASARSVLATSARRAATPDRPVPWWALAAAGLAPVLLTLGELIADRVQPASYSPVRDPVSALSRFGATDRWIVTAALLAVGIAYLLTAAGMAMLRTRARIGLVVSGLASMGIALCPEPYVGGTPQHMVFTSIGAAAIAVWPALTAETESPASVLISPLVTAAVTVLFVAMLGWLVVETQGGHQLGVAERVDSSIQLTWPFVVAWTLRARSARYRRPRPK